MAPGQLANLALGDLHHAEALVEDCVSRLVEQCRVNQKGTAAIVRHAVVNQLLNCHLADGNYPPSSGPPTQRTCIVEPSQESFDFSQESRQEIFG